MAKARSTHKRHRNRPSDLEAALAAEAEAAGVTETVEEVVSISDGGNMEIQQQGENENPGAEVVPIFDGSEQVGYAMSEGFGRSNDEWGSARHDLYGPPGWEDNGSEALGFALALAAVAVVALAVGIVLGMILS